ncbi:craniofacial development protein 2 [Biomphalaria glabrata]|nr:craniofacial development protein 2 [Biomphalaria glabrata]
MKRVSGGGRKQESFVWEYFRYDADSDKSVCLCIVSNANNTQVECGKALKGKNSTNLKTHLESFHVEAYNNVIEKEKTKVKFSAMNNPSRANSAKSAAPAKIGAWNVRTLLDNDTSDRPQRRTALVARELHRYNIDIAALSETRLADEGELCERGAGYTFFWSGRSTEVRRESGVGFAIKTSIVSKLVGPPKGISDRLMTLKLPLQNGKKHISIVSCYAPTMTNPDDVIAKFYEELNSTLLNIPKTEKLLILGDFNARVGSDHHIWKGVLGKFGIDYVITRQSDRQDIRVTKSCCGAECGTDHRLIITKLNIRIQPKRRPQKSKPLKRLNTASLADDKTEKSLADAIENCLKSTVLTESNVDKSWECFKEAIYSTALNILVPMERKHQDWFDENSIEIRKLLDEKHKLHKLCLNNPNSQSTKDAFTNIRKNVQKQLRQMQDTWLSKKVETIQEFADKHDMKNFYHAINEIYGPTKSGSSPLLNADGTILLTDKEEILKRWAEHFEKVLNTPSIINEAAIDRLQQVSINEKMDDPPTLKETDLAIQQLASGKAPGADSIPAEVYKKVD